MKATSQQYYKLEVRAASDSDLKIRGLACPYNQWSEPIYGEWHEQVTPGAFGASLSEDILLLYQHDMSLPLARVKNGSLTLFDERDGLYFEASLPQNTRGKDLYTEIVGGLYDGVSVGFYENQGGSNWVFNTGGKLDERYITSATLVEASIVTLPAFPQTNVQARSLYLAEKEKSPALNTLQHDPRVQLELKKRRLALAKLL